MPPRSIKKYAQKKKTMRKSYSKSSSSSLKRAVAQVLRKNVETKATITSATESFLSTLSSPQSTNSILLNSITTGASLQNRLGCKINAKYVDVRGQVIFPTDAPAVYTKIFLIMCNEGDDPINDLLETNAAVFGGAGNDTSAVYARVNTTKYRILGTKMIRTGNTGGLTQTALFQMNVNLKGQMISYENTSSNTTPSNKKIILHYFSRRADNDESLGTAGEITWNAKFYFTDM